MRRWWIVGAVVLLAGLVTAYFGYQYYQALSGPNIRHSDKAVIYIYPGATMDSLESQLLDHLISKDDFNTSAWLMKFDEDDLITGRYDLSQVKSNRELINMLRSGNQSPVNVIIHNERGIEDVAGKISQYLLLDSLEVLSCIMDSSALKDGKFSEHTLLTMIIPNTYQMYWNISCRSLIKRLQAEYDRFWNTSRLDQADSIGLSPAEVYTLASIVDRETIALREKPIVAGVYLNRLKKGMLLQADPTVVFANNILDTRRVLYKHLEIDSPYNTYKYPGLPPGPIGIASISGIDAVLRPEKHDYIYMVAKADNSGLHNFSTNLRNHNQYARAYQQWLNQRGL